MGCFILLLQASSSYGTMPGFLDQCRGQESKHLNSNANTNCP